MKKKIVLVSVLLTLLLAACATYGRTASTEVPYMYEQSAPSVGSGMTDSADYALNAMPTAMYVEDVSYNTSGTGVTTERMVIMNVDVTVVVADPTAKAEAIDELAKSLGGWVVSMNMYQTYTANSGTVPQINISIRVPSDKLDSALAAIKADVVDVTYENRSSQDITASYVDLESQLRNLQQAEEDLQAIMDEARNNPGNDATTKTQDVLNVYNQIVMVRGQIEQIQGEMKYYEESSATSLINVTLIAEETIQPLKIGPWTPKAAAQDAYKGLVKFLRSFVEFVIWLVVLILPVVIVVFGPIALIVWAIVAGIKRRKAKKAIQKQ
jgi:hypothetical protein